MASRSVRPPVSPPRDFMMRTASAGPMLALLAASSLREPERALLAAGAAFQRPRLGLARGDGGLVVLQEIEDEVEQVLALERLLHVRVDACGLDAREVRGHLVVPRHQHAPP